MALHDIKKAVCDGCGKTEVFEPSFAMDGSPWRNLCAKKTSFTPPDPAILFDGKYAHNWLALLCGDCFGAVVSLATAKKEK